MLDRRPCSLEGYNLPAIRIKSGNQPNEKRSGEGRKNSWKRRKKKRKRIRGEKRRGEEWEMLKFHTPSQGSFLDSCGGRGGSLVPGLSPAGSYKVHYLTNFLHTPQR